MQVTAIWGRQGMTMNAKHYAQMWYALNQIRSFETARRLKANSWDRWGLEDENEALEMAYENVLEVAKRGLKRVRHPSSIAGKRAPGEG